MSRARSGCSPESATLTFYRVASRQRVSSRQIQSSTSQSSPASSFSGVLDMGIYCLYTQISNIYGKRVRVIIIRMLNPFAIEKELLAKTDSLTDMLTFLKGLVADSIMKKQKEGRVFPRSVIQQCVQMKETFDAKNRQYVCKICGKEFNEGRKLGGHVSRAHKGSQASILEVDSDTETYQPRKLTLELQAARGCRESQVVHFEQESDSEVYVPRESKRRGRVALPDMEEETCTKKLKMDEPIFFEEP